MVYRLMVVPVSLLPLDVSVTAKTDVGSAFHWVGPWLAIRLFLVIHMLTGSYEIADIEDDLRKGTERSFDIDTSETLLLLAEFSPVRS
jgi:hypothetical protein